MSKRDFTEFLRERLQAWSPGSDVSDGSLADTEVLQPALDYYGGDIFTGNLRQLMLDTISREYPALGVQPDSVLDDTVAKILSVLQQAVVREIALDRRRLTTNPRAHTVDSARLLAGTMFLPRNDGGRASGTTRLYYLSPLSEIVRPENLFYARNGTRFQPTGAQIITRDEMQLNLDIATGEYYFDIRVVAIDPGVAGNIEPGMLDRAPSVSRAVRVTNPYRFGGGTDGDTVESIFAQAEVYPTAVAMTVERGIKALLNREFPGATRRIEVVGAGDPLMNRDILEGGGLGPAILYGSKGTFVSSTSLELASNLFYALGAGFATTLGTGEPAEDYILSLHMLGTPGILRESRIVRVIDDTHVEIEDFAVPLSTSIAWTVRRRTVTVSGLPGGILFPTTSDGTIELRDGEVHLFGRTDAYLQAETEASTSDLGLTPEDNILAAGVEASTGGVSFPIGHGWIRLDYTPELVYETTVGAAATITDAAHGALKGIVLAAVRGTNDLSAIRTKPGFWGSRQDYFAIPTFSSWWSDIVQVFDGGAWTRYRLEDLTATDLGGGVYAYVAWVASMPADPPLTSPIRFVRNIPDGVIHGQTMFVIHDTAAAGRYRIIDTASGWYYGAGDVRNRLFEVRLAGGSADPVPAVSKATWSIVADIDVDLREPKTLRVPGADLKTTSGSYIVTTVGSTDFEARGVKADDILRITTGPDADDYVVTEDPYGPGHALLKIERPLTSSGVQSYQVFDPHTPVDLPILDATSLTLLDSDGAPSTAVPSARSLGAVSSQFVNAGVGTKWSRGDCVTGPMGRTPLAEAAHTFTPAADNYLMLQVFSKQWGYFVKLMNSGGPYDIATGAGRIGMLLDFNETLPARYLVIVDEEGNIVSDAALAAWSPGDGPQYLAVNPHDSDESGPWPGVMLLAIGDTAGLEAYRLLDDQATAPSAIPVFGVGIMVTSRTVMFSGMGFADLIDRLSISAWNDVVEVTSGKNAGQAGVVNLVTYGNQTIYAHLYPHTTLLPDRPVLAKVGSPSIGLGRVFFETPTLFEAGPSARFTTEDGREYVADPRRKSPISPAYPNEDTWHGETVRGLLRTGASNQLQLPDTASTYDIQVGDRLIPWVRRIWFGHDYAAGVWSDASDRTFVFVFEDGPTITITTTAGVNYDLVGAGPNVNIIDLFNTAFGEMIAESLTIGANTFLAINTSRRLTTVAGDGPTSMSGMVPATTLAYGNLSVLAQQPSVQLQVVMIWYTDARYVRVELDPGTGENLGSTADLSSLVRFRVERPLFQRFPARQIAAQQHANGLYYIDMELMSRGCGDEWNLEPDVPLVPTGYRALGYRLTTSQPVTSFSTAEEPALHVSPWIQDAIVADGWGAETPVHGEQSRMYYDRSSLVASAQALFETKLDRETCQSALARGMFPARVYLGLSYVGGPTEDVLRDLLTDFIVGQGEVIDISEIVKLAMRNGVTRVETPIELAVAYVNQDRSVTTVVGKDRVEVPRMAGFSVGRLTLSRVG